MVGADRTQEDKARGKECWSRPERNTDAYSGVWTGPTCTVGAWGPGLTCQLLGGLRSRPLLDSRQVSVETWAQGGQIL